MMDKRTLWVVVACMAALFIMQKVVNTIWPPIPKKPKPDTAIATNVEPPKVEGESPPSAEPKIEAAPAAVETAEPRPPEQIVVLSNTFVRVEFTSHGGGIRTVELLHHRANGAGNVILNQDAPTPALATDTTAFTIEQPQSNVVVMRATGVTKQFTLGNDYLLQGRIEMAGGATNLSVTVGTAGPVDAKEPPDLIGVGWLVGESYEHAGLKHVKKEAQQKPALATWAAVKSQFFTMLVTPATNAVAIHFDKVTLPAPAGWKAKEPPQGMTAWLELSPSGAPTGSRVYEFSYYAGPKQYDRLVALGASQEDVMQFGMFGFFSVWLLKGMNFFYRLAPNYGVSIILITFIIKIIFWPVQAKSIKSMKEMQKFQPAMQKLREKYKDDAQRMNAEMMKLYKEHKINPFAGCLPMVVQIPVFYAFYTMLRSAIELRGAHFLWIKDLAQPDTIAKLAGFPLNPLPLVMGASMIWQMKLTPQTGDSQQQKMMMFMPLIFLFICYTMSSGLVLYWTVQQFLSIAQQWWSLRQVEPAPVTAGKKP